MNPTVLLVHRGPDHIVAQEEGAKAALTSLPVHYSASDLRFGVPLFPGAAEVLERRNGVLVADAVTVISDDNRVEPAHRIVIQLHSYVRSVSVERIPDKLGDGQDGFRNADLPFEVIALDLY